MSALPVVVVGAGGHGQVVADALQASGRTVLGFVDPPSARAVEVAGLGNDSWLSVQGGYELANGISGTGKTADRGRRRVLQERLEAAGFCFAQVRHPAPIVSPGAEVGRAVQLLARAVVQTAPRIGDGRNHQHGGHH